MLRSTLTTASVSLLAIIATGNVAFGQAATSLGELSVAAFDRGRRPKARRIAPTDAAPAGTFELGELSKASGNPPVPADVWNGRIPPTPSQSTVTARDVYKYNRNTLDDAVSILPGVSSSNTGGSRNERLISVRGFDRNQVPLSIDGIRVYLPADNRLDFGRFLTPDLAEVQVQKGYVTVLNGPGGMGGAINLVTRKPTREAEGELRTGIDIGNRGIPSAVTAFGILGTRQENYYLQASGTVRDSNGFYLSQGFRPFPLYGGPPIEDGARRDFSAVSDYRVNVKAAITPNITDEYSISYTKQSGQKGAPYSIYEPVRGITPPSRVPSNAAFQRDWRWPYWDIDSLYFLSRTALGDSSYVLTRAYYNTFSNLLSAYDDSSFRTQTTPRSFNSFYDDYAYGGSVEAGTDLIPFNTLKGAVHYRRDSHTERQVSAPGVRTSVSEPDQENLQDTYSIAAEDTFHATDRLDIVAGVSYDRNSILKAEDFATNRGGLFNYPVGTSNAFNWQSAAYYRTSETGRVYGSVSSRTRFPTLFERYSTRFGDAVPNPGLRPERATNYEIGYSELFFDALRLSPAVFYSDLEDVIQSVSIGNNRIQNQNIGTGRYYGYEVAAEWRIAPEYLVGANYTYLIRELNDPLRPALKATGTPLNQAFVYATWQATPELSFSPSVEMASGRYSTDRLENGFFKTGGYVLLNMQAQYAFNPQTTWAVGVRNLLDHNYALAYGFPEAGRVVYTNLRLTF